MYNFIYNPDGQGSEWTSTLPTFVRWNDAWHETRAVINAQEWQVLVDNNVYRTWTESGDAWLGYTSWIVVPNPEPEDNIDVAARYLAGSGEERSSEHRRRLMQDIDAQVFEPTARQLVEDPLAERAVESTSGGSSEKKSELEDYAGDLYAFDTTIVLTPADGAGYVEAKMTTYIDIVDPWAGAPSAIYALVCVLKIITPGQEAAGASARAHMFGPGDGPTGAVMPFVQDGANPAIWRSQTQEGRYWEDPETQASMRLLWDSGSLAVAETKRLDGYGDRDYAVVRAGLP